MKSTLLSKLLRVSVIVLVLHALLILFGCSAPQTSLPIPWTSPQQFDSPYREWYKVIHVRPSLNEKSGREQQPRVPVGHMYFQANADDEIYWVLGLDHKERGFLLKGFLAFQLVEAESSVEHKELGNFGLEGGIFRILGLSEGTVELEKVTAEGELPGDQS